MEAGKCDGEGIVAVARTRKRKAGSHQLRDFPPVVKHHGDRKSPRPIAACILEASVHPWWLHLRNLWASYSLHPSRELLTANRIGLNQVERWIARNGNTRTISRPTPASVDPRRATVLEDPGHSLEHPGHDFWNVDRNINRASRVLSMDREIQNHPLEFQNHNLEPSIQVHRHPYSKDFLSFGRSLKLLR